MKCKEFQIGDWVQDENAFQWQIIGMGNDYAYATFEAMKETLGSSMTRTTSRRAFH